MVAGGGKGFSRNCSDVGVEHKQSDGMFEIFCCFMWLGMYFGLCYWKGLEDLIMATEVF